MLSMNKILSNAYSTAKHEDFGDPRFKEGLNVLTNSINHESTLNVTTQRNFQLFGEIRQLAPE